MAQGMDESMSSPAQSGGGRLSFCPAQVRAARRSQC